MVTISPVAGIGLVETVDDPAAQLVQTGEVEQLGESWVRAGVWGKSSVTSTSALSAPWVGSAKPVEIGRASIIRALPNAGSLALATKDR